MSVSTVCLINHMIEMTTVTLERSCCICGYHIYCSILDLTIGEELLCNCEPTDDWDGYAIAVIKHEIVIGHFPHTFCAIVPCFFEEVVA